MKRTKRVSFIVFALVMLMAVSSAGTFADVTVRVLGVNASKDVDHTYSVNYTSDMTAYDALNATGIPHIGSSYVSAIEGLAAGSPTYWTGWMFRVEDVVPFNETTGNGLGAAEAIVENNEVVTWYFADPRGLEYPVITNDSSLANQSFTTSQDITVNVKSEYLEDAWNFIMSGFRAVQGIDVALYEKVGGDYVLVGNTKVETSASGVATIDLANVTPGTYYVRAGGEVHSSGSYNNLYKEVPTDAIKVFVTN